LQPGAQLFYLRQGAYAILHAGCLLLALEPFNIWPLGIIAVTALFAAVADQIKQPVREAIIAYFFFALAMSVIPFFWIFATIHRYTGERYVLTFFLGIGYTLLFYLKLPAFFTAARWLYGRGQTGVANGLAIAALLAVIDAISPELFPWSWGNSVSAFSWLRASASLGSVYLVSFVVILAGWLLHEVVKCGRAALQQSWPVIALVATFLVYGIIYMNFPDASDKHRKLRVLIVQTNIGAAAAALSSDAKFAAEAINRLFNQTLEGMTAYGAPNLILWPEGSMPFHASRSSRNNARIYSPTFDGALEYLSRVSGAGIVYHEMSLVEGRLYSQMSQRPATGRGEDLYRKRRLVPWGEYLPLETILPSLRRYFPEAGKFLPGHRANTIVTSFVTASPVLPPSDVLLQDLQLIDYPNKIATKYPLAPARRAITIKPLVCYEALFPEDARNLNADLIVNLSSDAWFGDGLEGHQHAGAASLRAVENGMPMVRAAMSGISYAVDARGNFLGRPTGQAHPENLIVEIPLERLKTPFSRFGMRIFYVLMLLAALPRLYQWLSTGHTRESK
jgi:apolipoprotein N-acyltransferase